MTPGHSRSLLTPYALVAASLCQLAATFQVETIPGDSANTQVFIAQAGAATGAQLCVLSGDNLLLMGADGLENSIAITLEKGTTAIDIADADGDGTPEIYSVVGTEIRRWTLDPEPSGPTSEVMFTQETLLSSSEAGPQPYVLLIDWKGRPALALPQEEGLSLFTLNGTLLEHFPHETQKQGQAPLQHTLIAPPQIGPSAALEIRADVLFAPPLPAAFSAIVQETPPTHRRATYTQAREASKLPPADWPWFLLAPAKAPGKRVMYAIAGSNQGDTFIRIRSIASGRDADLRGQIQYSPQRRYPGTLVTAAGIAPDFDADGYSDLLLWTSPRPGTSIDSLMRAAQARTWPVRLTVHPFSKIKGIYSGRPSARIELLLPISWSLALDGGSPLRHLILEDIDGDGRTDIALATSPTRFALWLCNTSGSFSAKPDYAVELPEAIEATPLVAKIGKNKTPVIALQGAKALYLLTAPR